MSPPRSQYTASREDWTCYLDDCEWRPVPTMGLSMREGLMIPNPLSNVTGWILISIHSLIGHVINSESGAAWGLSITSLTVFARLLTLPLVLKAARVSK